MTDLDALKAANAKRWAQAKVRRRADFAAVAKALIAPIAKLRYTAVEARTGVPWYFIAVVHEREASQNWNTHLAQGDPLHSVTRHVPAGEPAFNTWEEGAIDALVSCAPHAARNRDWSIGGLLTMLERYNGIGYASRGRPSPYVWSGTDQYICGKYVRDGVYDPEAVDSQLGCAGLLKAMMTFDPTISFGRSPIVSLPSNSFPPDLARPSIANPSKGSVGAFVASILSAIFSPRRK